MTLTSGYRLIDLPRERGREMLEVDQWAFAFAARPDEVELTLDCFPFERGRAVEIAEPSRVSEASVVAVHSSFDFQMRVPGGGTVATAGLTWVGVHQGHRRRGLLTAMIADHFARSRARGEAVSSLYAAEPAIYQRFGYGLASRDIRLKMSRKPELRTIPGSDELEVTLETASLDKHSALIRRFQADFARPGSNATVPEPLLRNMLVDSESLRESAEPQRIAVVRDGDSVVAWALFRRKADWNDWDPNGVVKVPAWGAHTAAATRRLWSVLTDFDLMASTHSWLMAPDDPWIHLLVDERAAKAEVRDNLWVRVLDVKAALEARAYEADADVVVDITDQQVPENAARWRVEIAGGEARVTPAGDTPADLAMGIQELGAAYLGGTSMEALARATLVEERTPGSAHALGRAMLSSLAPICNISF